MIWSGEWQGSGKPGFRERRDSYCNQCIRNDIAMWGQWGLRPIRLASFVTAGEIAEAKEEVATWMEGDWQKVMLGSFPTGYEAWKAVINNDLQAEIQDWWRERADSMAYHHLLNIRLLNQAYERIFDVISPDRVFGNGGFYYPWGIVGHIAKQRHISYFRYYRIGLHRLAWNYVRNNHELIDVSPAWESWLQKPWRSEQEQRVDQDLKNRGVQIDWKPKRKVVPKNISEQLGLDPNEPIALAATGVAWDANTNIRSEAFGCMYDWLWETIRWFAEHPQWQLVIRAHPHDNIAPNIAPETRTLFEREVQRKGTALPPNVYFVPHDHSVSTFEIASVSELLITYMSTIGLEIACSGLPVVVIGPAHYRGKGFTLDPVNPGEYFSMLSIILSGNVSGESIEGRSLLAKRYWYLYAYHASVVMGLVELGQRNLAHEDEPYLAQQVPEQLTCQDLLPGANPYLDHICDSVIHDLPIMGPNRWPPERQE
ncbi:MAG: hypothetical protein E3J72_01125 [Planctomycetota bacterium]|nr:MAG: hypothetical protein E3J72_01125 [Planctomycetota bacterium]